MADTTHAWSGDGALEWVKGALGPFPLGIMRHILEQLFFSSLDPTD